MLFLGGGGGDIAPFFIKKNMRYSIDGVELTLEDLKTHLRVDFDDDDAYIDRLGKTALSQIVNTTRRSVDELKEMNNGVFPIELHQAALQLVDLWYKERSAVSSINKIAVPYGLELLVKPFTKLAR